MSRRSEVNRTAPLRLTERAIERARAIRDDRAVDAGESLAVALAADGSLGFVLRHPGADDHLYESGDEVVLLVPSHLISTLAGLWLDVEGESGRSGFRLRKNR